MNGSGDSALWWTHSRAFRGWNLWISGDQLRTGAAHTAAKIAELLHN
jgi:aspartate-semialdehyde dehydrogenase